MRIFTALAFCSVASTVSAQTCTGENQIIIPELETVKAAFLETDYDEFARLLGNDIVAVYEDFEALFDPLDRLLDGPFSACTTVLQNHINPGFYQDIVAFEHSSLDVPVYLLLEGVEVGVRFRYTQFLYNDVPSEVFENIR